MGAWVCYVLIYFSFVESKYICLILSNNIHFLIHKINTEYVSVVKHEVVGVVGEGVAIPCNCTPGYAHTGDRPALILWYKDRAKLPIYRSVCFIITIHFTHSWLNVSYYYCHGSMPWFHILLWSFSI